MILLRIDYVSPSPMIFDARSAASPMHKSNVSEPGGSRLDMRRSYVGRPTLQYNVPMWWHGWRSLGHQAHPIMTRYDVSGVVPYAHDDSASTARSTPPSARIEGGGMPGCRANKIGAYRRQENSRRCDQSIGHDKRQEFDCQSTPGLDMELRVTHRLGGADPR